MALRLIGQRLCVRCVAVEDVGGASALTASVASAPGLLAGQFDIWAVKRHRLIEQSIAVATTLAVAGIQRRHDLLQRVA